MPEATLNDQALLRYARHIMLDAIGIDGQTRLLTRHALLIGAGGLGSAAALYLCAAGVGRLTIVDPDTVEISNLQRQIAHDMLAIGTNKAKSIQTRIAAINPDCDVRPLQMRADTALLTKLLPDVDIVLDGSDNYATRHAVNAACVAARTPLVNAAAIRFDGQLSVFDLRHAHSPCYACIFPPNNTPAEAHCATMGIFAPLVGMIGSMQAAEALKILAAPDGQTLGTPLIATLWLWNALHSQAQTLSLKRDPNCPICSSQL